MDAREFDASRGMAVGGEHLGKVRRKERPRSFRDRNNPGGTHAKPHLTHAAAETPGKDSGGELGRESERKRISGMRRQQEEGRQGGNATGDRGERGKARGGDREGARRDGESDGRENDGDGRILSGQPSSLFEERRTAKKEGRKKASLNKDATGAGSSVSLGIYFAAAGLMTGTQNSRRDRRATHAATTSFSLSPEPPVLSSAAFPSLHVANQKTDRAKQTRRLHARLQSDATRAAGLSQAQDKEPERDARANEECENGEDGERGVRGGPAEREGGATRPRRGARGPGGKADAERAERRERRTPSGAAPSQSSSGVHSVKPKNDMPDSAGWLRGPQRRDRETLRCTYTPENRDDTLRRDLRLLRHQFHSAQREFRTASAKDDGDESSRLRETAGGEAVGEEGGERFDGDPRRLLDPRRLKYRGRRIQARGRRSDVKAKMLLERELRKEMFTGQEQLKLLEATSRGRRNEEREDDDGSKEDEETREQGRTSEELGVEDEAEDVAYNACEGRQALEATANSESATDDIADTRREESRTPEENEAADARPKGEQPDKREAEEREKQNLRKGDRLAEEADRDEGGRDEEKEARREGPEGQQGKKDEEDRLREQLRRSEDVRRYELCKHYSSLKRREKERFLASVSSPFPLSASSSSAPGGLQCLSASAEAAKGATEDAGEDEKCRDAHTSQRTVSTPQFVAHYVDMVTGEDDWESALSDFLVNLHRLQVRLLTKAPQKQATQRRFVLGLKAALVALSARKRVQREAAKSEKEETDVEKKERDSESREREEESEDEEENMEKKRTPKLIVLAANCEPTVSEGGLSDLIQRVLAAARAKGVPVVFCASRNRMKKAVGSTMRQSCVTVKNDAGVERQLKNLLLLAETKRRKWRELHAPANGEADAPSPRTEENETVKRTNKRECEVKSKSGEGGKESSPLVDAVCQGECARLVSALGNRRSSLKSEGRWRRAPEIRAALN
ncbi:ribosomal protein L7Ae [Toxoplasma gondii TgCatPRC2]|uniref:Ribosomal protein L7Ae n=1 Tax=Toxoplasma gondii TgCatPRC2 TaxID=1130821 RepID=A0A151HFS0_TOXGO|nr:ribosomal protein L7Ae [Toxoplasma gondii TgCatPRC2]